MRVIDSHTEGEPTRLIVEGGPDLGNGPLSERVKLFAAKFDNFRCFAVDEPRGYDAVVGALLCKPVDPTCAAGLIFFNNAGYLGMCGHGTIGAAVTLAHMGKLAPGHHKFETPVGVVGVELLDANTAKIENVESFLHLKNVEINVEGHGKVSGDVAWGGNWFFLCKKRPCELVTSNIAPLTAFSQAIKTALIKADITGKDGGEIDHIELFSPPVVSTANSRNFVLCPGGAYDRSPCGTGTSAKLACLAVSGELKPGGTWIQESITGSRFVASYRLGQNGGIIPSITGRAFVTAEAKLVRDLNDFLLAG